MGICTSISTNKKKRNPDIKAKKLPIKIKDPIIEKEIVSTRSINKNKREKLLGKIEEKELKRNNTVNLSFNKKINNSNIQKIQSSYLDSNQIENSPSPFEEKISENKLSEKRNKVSEQNALGSKEENTIASLESKINKNNNEKNLPEQYINNSNINNNEENQNEKELNKSNNNKIEDIKILEEKDNKSKKELNDSKIKEKIKEENNINEDDSFITFFKDFNKSNIYDNKREYQKPISYNNNYNSFKGNLFNINKNVINISQELNESNTNSDSNKIKDSLYYFSEFHFTQKKYYSTEKDFNNLLNSQIFQNKIILTNKLLNLQERQWYKESINLSDSLKINRENIYLDTASFNHYLNKMVNIYNHFNWLTWAVSYYYFNSLLFNKNHWFSSKNNNLPSYDNLDWIKGFEWKGIYIKVMTYQESKKIRNEIKALNYAFLDYINIIDTFKNKSGNINLLSNEIIFPFITYSYFGGIVIYFSVVIKKFYYYEENSIFMEVSKDNSNTKSNTKSFEIKDKQFDEISEITILDYKKMKKESKNFLNFNEDHINLNENVINNDINISKYSKLDLENSKILSKITENNLIKIIDDLDDTSNINYEKYKYMLTNIYSLLPNLFEDSQVEQNNNLSYIKYKNNYNYPRLYDIIKSDIKDNEINTLNSLLDEPMDELNINVYQTFFNEINFRIIYQYNHDKKNEKLTNYFVRFPFIQNK